jgi:hypothetical protein
LGFNLSASSYQRVIVFLFKHTCRRPRAAGLNGVSGNSLPHVNLDVKHTISRDSRIFVAGIRVSLADKKHLPPAASPSDNWLLATDD